MLSLIQSPIQKMTDCCCASSTPAKLDEVGSFTEGGKDVPLGDSLQIQFWVNEGVKPAVNL